MKIPAGLSDPNMEIFAFEGELHFIKNGRNHSIDQLDVSDLAVFRHLLDNDSKALNCIEEMGIIDPILQIRQYLFCNFGSFDERADLTPDGVTIKEYWDCGKRGSCPFEGKLCSLPCGMFGQLTPREIDVIKLIGQDLPDKIIADRLGISFYTVCVHRLNIERKLDVHTKVGIVIWAKEKGII